MGKVIDLKGQRFGRLLVLRINGKSRKATKWLCRCDCGAEHSVGVSQLRNGDVRSCGCYRREHTRAQFRTHGKTGTTEHRIWKQMRARCGNPNNKKYKDYGGRGIKVCARWQDSFEAFFADIGPRPSRKHSVDREDVDGNYDPDNCKWATAKEQAANTRERVELRRLRVEIESLRTQVAELTSALARAA